MDQAKIKHLEFIQNTITRMNTNSFILKGWCITLVSGVIALSIDKDNPMILFTGLPISIIFWFLDSYYLWLEKIFRIHYSKEVEKKETDFNLNIENFKTEVSFLDVFGSISIAILYFFQLGLLVGTYIILIST